MTIGMPTEADRVLNLNTGSHALTCRSIALKAMDRSLAVRISPAFPNVKPWGERKRLRFLSTLMIVLTPLRAFARILRYLYVDAHSEGPLKTQALWSP